MHLTGRNIEPPATQCESAGRQGAAHCGIGLEVLELQQDIFLAQAIMRLEVRDFLPGKPRPGRPRVVEPALEVRRVVEVAAGNHRAHGSAVGMAADDDVFHLQDCDGVFDGTRLGEITRGNAVSVRGRHQISDIAHGEELTGLGRGEQVGRDPTVGAGNE